MGAKQARVKVIILIILSVVFVSYLGYIIYLHKSIKEIQSQNLVVMDQMRMLYELEKNIEFSSDTNLGEENNILNGDLYCVKETAHFKIYSHNKEICSDIANYIEEIYSRILDDLRYNIRSSKKIGIYIFKDENEYRSKIRQPMWSMGRAIYNKNSFYSFEGVNLSALIPHELTHLLFYHFMGRHYDSISMRWLSEGLATYEESKFSKSDLINNLEREIFYLKEGECYSFRELIDATALKGKKIALIGLWYAQSYSMVEFMINHLGREKFNRFCLSLKNNNDIEKALLKAYGNKFKDLEDFQKKWFNYIKNK